MYRIVYRIKKRSCFIFLGLCLVLTLEGCSFNFLSDLYPTEDTLSVHSEDTTSVRADTDAAGEKDTSAEERGAGVYVHVCGCVKKPGLYHFPEGERVDAAIRAAGGFADNADEKSVNLAEPLTDGTQIEVRPLSDPEVESSSGSTGDNRVNLNTAQKEELMTLNGIGEGRAMAIIAYREEHGGFASPEELKEVDGIGEGIYRKIKGAIKV